MLNQKRVTRALVIQQHVPCCATTNVGAPGKSESIVSNGG